MVPFDGIVGTLKSANRIFGDCQKAGTVSKYMASRCPELRLSATARMNRRKLHSRTGTFKLHSCAEGEEREIALGRNSHY